MPTLSPEIERELGVDQTAASLYLREPSQLLDHAELAPHAHAVRYAWDTLKLSGVLCVDGQPSVYFKEQARFSTDQKEKLVKFLWNQGTATKLVLIEDSKIEIHSSLARPPSSRNELWGSETLVESISRLADELEAQKVGTLLKRIETGQFYRDYPQKFDPKNAVDQCLLGNLRATRNRLKELGFKDVEHIHAILGRLLFISFLEERNFLQSHHFPGKATGLKEFFELNISDPEKGIRLLYSKLFGSLQKEFNGSMFSEQMEDEKSEFNEASFALLSQFLNGEDIGAGQMVLSFWAYDFSVIPVETISAIYEDFLEAEDSETKHRLGAYYTPRHLAEMVVNMAIKDGKSVDQWKFLDPSCGSGVFLVIAFNLLAEHWLYRGEKTNHRRHKTTKVNQLIEILCNQIRGVDLNPTACSIAAFSLYLALFEKLQPVDLESFKEKLQGKPILPNLLKPNALNRDGVPVVTCKNFHELSEDFPVDFDCAIGNPPWKGRGKVQDAFPFVSSISKYVKPQGVTSFVLPTTMLVLKTSTLNKDWFCSQRVSDVVNLADYQNVLFTGPKLPSLILRFVNEQPDVDHEIRYLTPKIAGYDPRQGMICIESGDLKFITQKEILFCESPADFRLLWLTNYYGTPRDIRFINRLRRMPKLEELFTLNPDDVGGVRLKIGVGFKPFYPGETKDTYKPLEPWKLTDSYLPSSALRDLYVGPDDWGSSQLGGFLSQHKSRKGTPASIAVLRRKPEDGLFEPPMVLLNLGFTKAAFCCQKVRFQHAIHSISGKKKDEACLKLLAAFLNSSLVNYFSFHCAARWIAGRNQVHIDDKMILPFPLPNSSYAAKDAALIIDKITAVFERIEKDYAEKSRLINDAIIDTARAELDELILEYFSVSDAERALIKDTCELLAPSIRKTPNSKSFPAVEAPSDQDVSEYGNTLAEVLNSWARSTRSKFKIEVEASKHAPGVRLRLLSLKMQPNKRLRHLKTGDDQNIFEAVLKRMENALRDEDHSFQYLRGFTYFEGSRLHLLKPNTRRHWSRTAALNDADEILSHLRDAYFASTQ